MEPVDGKDYLRRAILHRLDPKKHAHPNPFQEAAKRVQRQLYRACENALRKWHKETSLPIKEARMWVEWDRAPGPPLMHQGSGTMRYTVHVEWAPESPGFVFRL